MVELDDHRDEERRLHRQLDRALHGTRLDSDSLDRLATAAVDRGGRRRTRQRWAASGGAVLATAAVFAAGWALVPGQAPTAPATSLGFASGGDTDAKASSRDDELRALTRVEGTAVPKPDTGAEQSTRRSVETAPVRPVGRGVTCGEPADEKMICQLPGGAQAVVNWRDVASRPDYLNGSKAGRQVTTVRVLGQRAPLTDEGVVVGPARGGVFITVQAPPETPVAQVRRIAASLKWATS